jgi:hypothetical protein
MNDDGNVDGLKQACFEGITRKAYGHDLGPRLAVQRRQRSNAFGFICNARCVMVVSLSETA